MIYQLKGGLSINDIKVTLNEMNKKVIMGDIDLDSFYSSYLNLIAQNVEDFNRDIEERIKAVKDEVKGLQEDESNYLEEFLMISSLVHMSNLYRRVAEKLVDGIMVEKDEKRHR